MLKHLSVNEMVGLTQRWVDPTQARAIFAAIPEIAPLLAKVDAIHEQLSAARPAPKGPPPALKALIAEAATVDAEHDALARAIHAGIVADRAFALAERPPATARAQRAQQVLARLFPDGLAIVNASHLAESGNTARIEALLDRQPSLAAFLEAVPVQPAATLLTLTRRLIAVGQRLANLEYDRGVLTAKAKTAPVTRATMNRLRARWIRLVNQILSLLELSDAPTETIETIRGPIVAASTRAGRRYEPSRPTPTAHLALVTEPPAD